MFAAPFIALSAALFMTTASVGGVDMDYEGEVDIYSGSPITAEDNEDLQRISLADGGMFDKNAHTFIYTVPGGNQSISSNVANEMITTDYVIINNDEGLSAKLYRDGEEVEKADLENITEPGMYSLVVYGPSVEYQMLTFTIVPKVTGMLTFYKLPLGFDAVSVTVSGEPKTIRDVGRVDMTEEGDYMISYRCNLTEQDYLLSVKVDHTPPDVFFEGVTEGVARGPVTIKGVRSSDYVEIKCGGEKVSAPSDNIITDPGDYEVTVTDEAGNAVTEKFTIKFYLNFQGVLFGTIFLVVIGSAVGYMVWSRKKLKVR